jgi:ubiquitin fusion degradation protein 1
MPSRFEHAYNCYPMAFSGKAHLEDGDKILLPPSALHELAQMNVEYPMLFELTNPRMGKRTHCGVLEFSAEEGRCYVPYWMLANNLLAEEGGILNVVNVSLKKAQFVKFRPQSVDFLDISNPRAVLEKTLRKFTCVTVGDQICIPYNDKNYYLEIREVNPDGAASIIETDCNVDFEEPVGYKEVVSKSAFEAKVSSGDQVVRQPRPLQKSKFEDKNIDSSSQPKAFQAFSGDGARIDGKKPSSGSKDSPVSSSPGASSTAAATPPAVLNPPVLLPRTSIVGDKYSKKKTAASAFTGTGHTLKK